MTSHSIVSASGVCSDHALDELDHLFAGRDLVGVAVLVDGLAMKFAPKKSHPKVVVLGFDHGLYLSIVRADGLAFEFPASPGQETHLGGCASDCSWAGSNGDHAASAISLRSVGVSLVAHGDEHDVGPRLDSRQLEEFQLDGIPADLTHHLLNFSCNGGRRSHGHLGEQEIASRTELWLSLYRNPLQGSQGSSAVSNFGGIQNGVNLTKAFGRDVHVLEGLDVVLLVDGDRGVTVFILADDEVGASVAIFSTLDGTPNVGTVNLLADLIPFRVGLVSGPVEIIYMTTHGTNDERSALLVFLMLRKPYPHASLRSQGDATKTFEGCMEILPKSTGCRGGAVHVLQDANNAFGTDA